MTRNLDLENIERWERSGDNVIEAQDIDGYRYLYRRGKLITEVPSNVSPNKIPKYYIGFTRILTNKENRRFTDIRMKWTIQGAVFIAGLLLLGLAAWVTF